MDEEIELKTLNTTIQQLIQSDGLDFVQLVKIADLDIKHDLQGVDLSGIDLHGINLIEADLRWTNLEGANLRRCRLSKANLENAILKRANLESASLDGANLTKADLTGANLTGASFRDSYLESTNLSESNFYAADFAGTNVQGAILGNFWLSLEETKVGKNTHPAITERDRDEEEYIRGDDVTSSYSTHYEETGQRTGTRVRVPILDYSEHAEVYEDSQLQIPDRFSFNPRKSLTFARTWVTTLDELAQLISPNLSPRVITLRDFLIRYRLTGVGRPAMEALFQSRQILLRTKNHRDIGASFFHSGLFLFHWAEFFGAQQHFSTARRSWSREKDNAWICLTYYAKGLAQRGIHMYEDAMVSFEKAERWLARIQFAPPSHGQGEFIGRMTDQLQEWQARLRDDMLLDFRVEEPVPVISAEEQPTPATKAKAGEAEEKTPSTPEAETVTRTASVPPPFSVLSADPSQSSSPVSAHTKINDNYTWYKVSTEDENFLPDVVQGSWVLVNSNTAEHEFKQDELIVVQRGEDINGSIVLEPPTRSWPMQHRIYLGSSQFDGRFVRDVSSGKVALSPYSEQFLHRNEILGIVVGLWLPRLRPAVPSD